MQIPYVEMVVCTDEFGSLISEAYTYRFGNLCCAVCWDKRDTTHWETIHIVSVGDSCVYSAKDEYSSLEDVRRTVQHRLYFLIQHGQQYIQDSITEQRNALLTEYVRKPR
jgi:hypothetical protein